MSKLVKSRELSKIVSISVYTILKLTREGKIPAYQINGKCYLYDPDEVISVIKNGLNKSFDRKKLCKTATDTHKEAI